MTDFILLLVTLALVGYMAGLAALWSALRRETR